MTEKKQEVETWHSIVEHGLTVPDVFTSTGNRHRDFLSAVDRTLELGDEITITPELRAATVDRYGESWCDDLTDDAQVRRWGQVYLAPGPLAGTELGAALDLQRERDAETERLRKVRNLHQHGLLQHAVVERPSFTPTAQVSEPLR